MDSVYQPLYCRNKCLTRTLTFSNFKKYESSSVRNLHDFGLNVRRTYKLHEDPDSRNGALEKHREFPQKRLWSGEKTIGVEGNSKDVSSIKVIKGRSKIGCNEIKKLDLDRQRIHERVQEMGYDRASILALDEERQMNMSSKDETVKQVKGLNDLMLFSDAVRHSNTESRRPWPSIEILHLSLHWKEIVISTIIAGALFASVKLFIVSAKPQVYSIRGRVLKSQWYGNSRSLPWEQKCFEKPSMKRDHNDNETPLFSSLNQSQRSILRTERNSALVRNESKSARTPHYPIRQSLYERNGFHERTMQPKNYKGFEFSNKRALYDSEVNGSYKRYADSGCTNGTFRTGKERTSNASEARNDGTNVAVDKRKRVSGKWSTYGGRALMRDDYNERKIFKMRGVNKEAHHQTWIESDKLDLERCISELYQTVQAVEHYRRTVMVALNEERQRSIVLEGEILKQKQAAAALSKEIQNLKESHNALLTSLRKKYSSAVAVRAAADLIYQDFEGKAVAE